MASGLIGNEVPRKGLWVRVPCPPLQETRLFQAGSCVSWLGKTLAAPQVVFARGAEPRGALQTPMGIKLRGRR